MKVIFKNGDIKDVTPNEAHTLIEKGQAKLFKGPNKMLVPEKKRGYKTK